MQANQIIRLNGKLPRVVWHPSGRQFSSRIGIKLYKRNGKEIRDRDFQLLGKDEREAMQNPILKDREASPDGASLRADPVEAGGHGPVTRTRNYRHPVA